MEIVDDLKAHIIGNVSDDAKCQHMMYMFAGYRAYIIGDYTHPYSPRSARQDSFEIGVNMAMCDKLKDNTSL